MNIALISREYPPFFGGGIGAYTHRFAHALAGAGHRPFVITVSEDGEQSIEEGGGVTVVRLPFIHANDWSAPHPRIATPETLAAFHAFHPVSVFAMQVARDMPALVRRHAIDIIEAPDTGALAWFLLNAARTGAPEAADLPPVVTVLHSPTDWIARWNRAPLRGRQDHELAGMERDQARWSGAVLSPSAALADWAAEHWALSRASIRVTPYALGDLEETARRRAGAGDHAGAPAQAGSGGPRRIVFTGRLEPRKGVDTLLAAFALLAPDHQGLELHLVGEDMPDPAGPGRFGAASVARFLPAAPGARAVHLHGRLPPARVAELLASADLVALPAPMDNFPLTCVEAMAHGRVIVAGAAGGMAEMIRDGREGLLFTPGDAAACAGALRRALALDPVEAARLGAAAAGRILGLCGNARIAGERTSHYAAILDARRARASLRPAPAAPARALLVNGGDATPDQRARLGAALAGETDFAHGWTSHEGVARVFATPTVESLARAPRRLGPVAVSARAAADPRIAPLLLAPPYTEGLCPDRAETESTWSLAVALCAAGYRGAVLPDVITEAPPAPEEAPELAALRARIADLERSLRILTHDHTLARGELAAIKSSRGWALLQRVYGLLHILRGRGLARPPVYDRPEEAGPAAGPRGRKQTA